MELITIRKQRQLIKLFLFVILFLTSLIILNKPAFARAGGGGGFSGGSSYTSSYNGRSAGLDFTILNFFLNLQKKYGDSIALLIFSPLIILHLFFSIFGSYYLFERIPNKIMFFIANITVIPLVILWLFNYGLILIILELCFSIKFIITVKKYGRLVTAFTEKQLEFEEKYQMQEKLALKSFLQNNPSFSIDKFKKRVVKAFYIIQESWMKQNLIDSEIFMADGTYEQFKIQINGMIEKNLVDVMEDLKLLNTSIIKTETSTHYDAIYVAFQAQALNYFINRKTRETINKEENSEPDVFAEVWSFLRRKGAKNLNSKGLLEGYCPNCGARIEGSRLVTCQSCNSFLRSGQHDWVLTGIYQMSSWKSTHNLNIPCIDYLMIQDPGFNLQNIEDKLSAIFWRLIEAVRRKIATPILKVSTDDFAKNHITVSNSCFEHPEFTNYDDAGINSIQVLNIGKENNKIFLFAQIIWNGHLPNRPETSQHKKDIFVLRRDYNATTDIRKSFTSSHCPNCGAIETYNGSNLCEYCNTIVNDEKKDWVLSDIYNSTDLDKQIYYSPFIGEYEMETLKNPPKPKKEDIIASDEVTSNKKESISSNVIKTLASQSGLFKKHKLFSKAINKESNNTSSNNILSNIKEGIDWLSLRQYSSDDLLRLSIAVMLADGITDSKEMEILRKICKHGFISEQELQKNIFEMQSKINPVDYALETTAIELDKNLMLMLIEIAASDGNIADPELKLLYKIAEKMKMPEKEFRDLVNSVYEKNWEK